jgi:ribokinase
MLNPAPSAPISDSLLTHLTYISPNEHEAEDLTGVHIYHDGSSVRRSDVEKAARELRKKGVKNILITLGSGGAALFNDEGAFFSPCVQEIAVVDPTAAGDSFVAAFCVGVCCGWSWESILQFANYTASLTVSKLGAMPSLPGLEQVESLLFNKTCTRVDTIKLR